LLAAVASTYGLVLAESGKGPSEMRFNLNRPSNAIFLISVVLALLSLIGALTTVSMLSSNAFLILAIAYVVLVIGNLVKGA
jgi:hypothetical protein